MSTPRATRKLPFKPGSKKDPWAKYWKEGLEIYQQVWIGTNRSGIEVGYSLGWTVADMLPDPWSADTSFRRNQTEIVKLFNKMLGSYGNSSQD